MIKRPLSQFEKVFLPSGEIVQLAVKVADPQYIPRIVKNLGNSLIALKLRTDGENLIHQDDFPVFGLPKSIGTAQEAADFVADNNLMNNFYKSLGSVAISDDIVAVTCSHLCTDGMSLVNAMDKCLEPDLPPLPTFPRSVEEIFSEQVANTDNSIMGKNIKKISRYPKGPKPEHHNPSMLMCKYAHNEIPFADLQCYDKNRGVPKGLTDSLWLSLSLSIESCRKTLLNIGCSNCVNIRPFMNQIADLSVGNCFTSLPIYAEDIRKDLTLKQIASQLRNNFEKDKKNGIINAAIKSLINGLPALSDDVMFAELSHVGPLPVRHPIIDASVRNNMSSGPIDGFMCLLTYSKKVDGVEKLCTRLQYPPTTTSDLEGKIISDTFSYIMTQIPLDTKLGDAYDQIRKFQTTNYYI